MKHELSVDEDWSLSIRTSYQGAIIYWQFRWRLMIISSESSRFLFHHRVIYKRGSMIPELFLHSVYISKRRSLPVLRDSLSASRDAERPWTSSPMSSATPADFIDVRVRKARAPHLSFERTEIVLLCILKKKISLSVYRFAPRDFARPTWHVQFAFHHWSLKN